MISPLEKGSEDQVKSSQEPEVNRPSPGLQPESGVPRVLGGTKCRD